MFKDFLKIKNIRIFQLFIVFILLGIYILIKSDNSKEIFYEQKINEVENNLQLEINKNINTLDSLNKGILFLKIKSIKQRIEIDSLIKIRGDISVQYLQKKNEVVNYNNNEISNYWFDKFNINE
jgi:hypothetical protein|tara:strand:+ start:3272 stop:3643 length:372 start_codon:yes stop_codon:yes gene_type:complete